MKMISYFALASLTVAAFCSQSAIAQIRIDIPKIPGAPKVRHREARAAETKSAEHGRQPPGAGEAVGGGLARRSNTLAASRFCRNPRPTDHRQRLCSGDTFHLKRLPQELRRVELGAQD
jgi:hypothetical protein